MCVPTATLSQWTIGRANCNGYTLYIYICSLLNWTTRNGCVDLALNTIAQFLCCSCDSVSFSLCLFLYVFCASVGRTFNSFIHLAHIRGQSKIQSVFDNEMKNKFALKNELNMEPIDSSRYYHANGSLSHILFWPTNTSNFPSLMCMNGYPSVDNNTTSKCYYSIESNGHRCEWLELYLYGFHACSALRKKIEFHIDFLVEFTIFWETTIYGQELIILLCKLCVKRERNLIGRKPPTIAFTEIAVFFSGNECVYISVGHLRAFIQLELELDATWSFKYNNLFQQDDAVRRKI